MKLGLRRKQGEFNKKYKFGDYEIYDLSEVKEDGKKVPIVNYRLLYYRRVQGQDMYHQAEVEYYNYHFGKENSPYLRKGYTAKGLIKLKEMLLAKGIPLIYLSINKDNIASKGVARKAGFIDNVVFHPNALEIMKKILEGLDDPEFAEKEFARFKKRFDEYMEKKKKLEEEEESKGNKRDDTDDDLQP